jgi:hypothetical protein
VIYEFNIMANVYIEAESEEEALARIGQTTEWKDWKLLGKPLDSSRPSFAG